MHNNLKYFKINFNNKVFYHNKNSNKTHLKHILKISKFKINLS